MKLFIAKLFAFAGLATVVACAPEAPEDRWPERSGGKADDPFYNGPPLAELDEVLPNGVPENEEPPPTDDYIPEKGYFLLNEPGMEDPLQSSVKSQGRRGVCSIFANIAYAEHLFLRARYDSPEMNERVPADLDLSEQYLQWSVKFQVNSFPNSSGSNAYYNLRALSQYGVVDEATLPYEPNEWEKDSTDDCEGEDPNPKCSCDGSDSQPTYCYTNGHPTDEVKAAPKYRLPSSRYLSARAIKQHINSTETGVVLGLKFFYQSWNHRLTNLSRNQTYWNKGYVLYPNDADKEDSSGDRRAGHGILIVGWDDTLEVPMVDGDGQATCTDAAATKVNPISGECPEGSEMQTEKGFYLFKNSWGTGSFGSDSGIGDGYGYISQRYVHEFASVRVADLPDISMAPELEPVGPTEKSATFSGYLTKTDAPDLHQVELAEGAHDIVVEMTGTGDADLYTKFDEEPDHELGSAGADCRPYKYGTEETCKHDTAAGSTLFIKVVPWPHEDDPADYEITVTWKE